LNHFLGCKGRTGRWSAVGFTTERGAFLASDASGGVSPRVAFVLSSRHAQPHSSGPLLTPLSMQQSLLSPKVHP